MTEPAAEPAAAGTLVLRQDAGPGWVRLVLNRPAARNALSAELMMALQSELDRLVEEGRARVIVLAANGPAFCAGHDLKELREGAEGDGCRRIFLQCSRLMISLTRLPIPVIAEVHGVATAAGCQLVAACDLAVAGASAWFATPGVGIGLFCTTPAVALSRSVAPKHAMEMLLTGDRLSAERALAIGLVNRVVEDDGLAGEVAALATKVASRPAAVVALGKEAFYRQLEMDLEGAYSYASERMSRNLQTADAQEGIRAFLDRRPPRWNDS